MDIINSVDLATHFGIESWMVKVLAVATVAIIAHIIFGYTIIRAKKAVKRTKNIWGKSVVESVHGPMALAIWLIAIKLGVDIAAIKFNQKTFTWLDGIAKIVIIAVFSWFLIRLTNIISQKIIKSKEEKGEDVDRTTVDALAKLIKLVISILTILIILQNLGISVGGVLAAGGVGGLVIGLAAKDLLANFFGGLTIYLDKPFKVGDWIRCEERSVEGTVEYIGWRHTRLRAFNKNPIYIPNAAFTTVVVENPSRMTHRRIKETVGLRYCDISKMEIITKEVREMLDSHDDVCDNFNSMAYFETFGPSSIDFVVYTLITNTEWHHFKKVKHEIMLKIAEIIEKHGAEIAFPTRTVYLEGEN